MFVLPEGKRMQKIKKNRMRKDVQRAGAAEDTYERLFLHPFLPEWGRKYDKWKKKIKKLKFLLHLLKKCNIMFLALRNIE